MLLPTDRPRFEHPVTPPAGVLSWGNAFGCCALLASLPVGVSVRSRSGRTHEEDH
jgi:hypothetical protein